MIPHITYFYQSHRERANTPNSRIKHTLATFELISYPLSIILAITIPYIHIRRAYKFLLIALLTLLIAVLFLSFFDIQLGIAHLYREDRECQD